MKHDDDGGTITTADVAATDEKVRDEQRVEPQPDRPESRAGENPIKDEPLTALFPADRVQDLRNRWNDLQVGFVDDPRRTVQEADQLVARVMKDLAQSFADARSRLEGQWDRGDQVSTEDLRVALRRYRSFFERLLSV